MSKNQKTYLLLFAVALIWGTIGYQLYKGYHPDIPEIEMGSIVAFKPETNNPITSYTITPDYRDPFTGKIYRKSVKIKKKIATKTTVVFPTIIYKGIINGSKNSYIISINGIDQIFQLKQTVLGVTLISSKDKSIVIKYQNQTKNYRLAK